MNFLCDNCKQKYHVADDKVRGRAVVRCKCKKCGHVTEVRIAGAVDEPGGAVEEMSAAMAMPASVPPPAPRPAPIATPRPATATALPTAPAVRAASAPLPSSPPRSASSAALPASAPRPAPAPGASPAPRPGVGIGSAPAVARSAVTAPGASPAPRAASSAALPAARPAPAPRPAAPAASPSNSGTASLRSSLASKPEQKTSTSALLNATETGWYAGVRDVPVGPLTRSELSARIESGDITGESLVWREGLDDWRPLRNVEELAELLRAAALKRSEDVLGMPGPRRSESSQNVVPIAQGRPASSRAPAAMAPAHDPIEDDEPTKMTSLADLIAKSEQPATRPPSSKPLTTAVKPAPAVGAATSSSKPVTAATPAPAPAVAKSSAGVAPSAPGMAPSAPGMAPSAPGMAPSALGMAPSAPGMAPSAPGMAPSALGMAPSAPGMAPSALGMAPSAPVVAPPVAATADAFGAVPPATAAPFTMDGPAPVAAPIAAAAAPAAVPVQRATQERRPGGLPIGAWVMMLGVGVAGVAIGVVVSSRNAPPPGPAIAAAPIAHTPAAMVEPPIGRTVGAEIHLPSETAAAPVAPAAVVAAHAPEGPAAAPTATPVAHRASAAGAPRARLGAAPSAAELAQLAALGGPGMAPGPTGPSAQLRNAPQETAPMGLTGSARGAQVIETLSRANVIGGCWTTALRRNAAHAAERLHVSIDVSPLGRASTVRVSGATDQDLVSCIQTRVRSQPFGAGGQITAEANYNFAPGQ